MPLYENLTQDILCELLSYEKTTGKLTWKPRDKKWFKSVREFKRWNKRFSNKEALTSCNSNGYKSGHVLGTPVKAHRIIWCMVYGGYPEEIDHIDGDPANNSLTNLRSVSHAENTMNRKLSNNNTSGVVGVYWSVSKGRWAAQIRSNNVYEYLGTFDYLSDAIKVRKDAELRYNFHKNHGRS